MKQGRKGSQKKDVLITGYLYGNRSLISQRSLGDSGEDMTQRYLPRAGRVSAISLPVPFATDGWVLQGGVDSFLALPISSRTKRALGNQVKVMAVGR